MDNPAPTIAVKITRGIRTSKITKAAVSIGESIAAILALMIVKKSEIVIVYWPINTAQREITANATKPPSMKTR